MYNCDLNNLRYVAMVLDNSDDYEERFVDDL